ncbi:hypothetical protein ACLOJK_035692 [Asimina triloba]
MGENSKRRTRGGPEEESGYIVHVSVIGGYFNVILSTRSGRFNHSPFHPLLLLPKIQIFIYSFNSENGRQDLMEEISTIVLDVNLDCPKCYKKVRKTLCKFNG